MSSAAILLGALSVNAFLEVGWAYLLIFIKLIETNSEIHNAQLMLSIIIVHVGI